MESNNPSIFSTFYKLKHPIGKFTWQTKPRKKLESQEMYSSILNISDSQKTKPTKYMCYFYGNAMKRILFENMSLNLSKIEFLQLSNPILEYKDKTSFGFI